jgi:hypothetical protein
MKRRRKRQLGATPAEHRAAFASVIAHTEEEARRAAKAAARGSCYYAIVASNDAFELLGKAKAEYIGTAKSEGLRRAADKRRIRDAEESLHVTEKYVLENCTKGTG